MTTKTKNKPILGLFLFFFLLVFTSLETYGDAEFIQLENSNWAEKETDQRDIVNQLKTEFTLNRKAITEGTYFFKFFYKADGSVDYVILSEVDKRKGSSHLFRINIGENNVIESIIDNYDDDGTDEVPGSEGFQLTLSPEILNGQVIPNLSSPKKEWLYFTITIPQGASHLKIKTDGGKGDADLFLKFGERPTLLSYDIKHGEKGNVEVCFEPSPKIGVYYIGIYGYYSFSSLNLSASFQTDNPFPKEILENGETVKDISSSSGQWFYKKLVVNENASNFLVRILNGQGDATLYVKYESNPTLTDYDFVSDTVGNNETIKIKTPEKGNYHIGIHAKTNFHGLNLTGSFIDNGKYGISVDDGYAMYEKYKKDPNFILLDTRELSEYNDVHIEGATHLPFYSFCFYDEFDKLDKNKKYLVHCRTENRSSQVAMMMEQAGFKDFVFFYGGILSWYEKKYPVIENLPPGPGP